MMAASARMQPRLQARPAEPLPPLPTTNLLQCLLPSLASPPAPHAVYRSNWLGAQGHDERKKLAEAAAAAQAAATQQRGQLP